MTADQIAAFFTRSDGSYLFARWGRPIAPVVFGVEEATLSTIKGALEAVVALAGHRMAETDPELGANLMIFFVRAWDELAETPHLDRLIPDLPALIARLKAAEANQYRIFRFDEAGAIRACFAFVRMDENLASVPAETLALVQAVQCMLVWSDTAFVGNSPVARHPGGAVVLRPDIASILRAGYDPVMPVVSTDPSHALRLAARVGQGRAQ